MDLLPHSGEGISEIHTRLSSSLDMLAGQVSDLEEVIGETVEGGREANTRLITSLQSLDYLRQTLEDLAMLTLFLAKLNNSFLKPSDVEVIKRKLKLRATLAILGGEEQAEINQGASEIDNLDLF